MQVSTDTKRLKARLNDIQAKMLFDRIIKPYKQQDNPYYYYSVQDKRNGVFLGHLPRAPYMNYTTSLSFHGYSDDSPLLKEIFSVVPLAQWLTSEMHIAFDFNLPYEQFHAVRPAKPAKPEWRPTSLYLGGASSSTRLYIYDKQVQMAEKRHIQTDTWTRVELRCKFSPMKRISKLDAADFVAANQYYVITDISNLPNDLKELTLRLNRDEVKWKDVDWRTKVKIREYAAAQAVNLYQFILPNVDDIPSFIYSPSTHANARTS